MRTHVNFAKEGLTANSLLLTCEHADIQITCCRESYNHEKGRLEHQYCEKYFLYFDMSHDEGFVCPHCTMITSSGLPVCKPEGDDPFEKYFGGCEAVNADLEYVKPQIWEWCELQFVNHPGEQIVTYNVIPDECSRKCFSVTFNKYCREFEKSNVEICNAIGEVFSHNAIGCREKCRVLDSLK